METLKTTLAQLASGTVFTAAVGLIPHWFEKKLGLALGCMALGSSVGGTIFPIILKNLIEHQRCVPLRYYETRQVS